jgi:hypothetical protein
MLFSPEAHEALADDHLSDDQVREWLATGMREGWSDTIDRLVTSFAAVAGRNLILANSI